LIWISQTSLVPISFYNSLPISHLGNEIILLGGLPISSKDNSGVQSCYKVKLPSSNNQTSSQHNYFIIERFKLQNINSFSAANLDSFQSNLQSFSQIKHQTFINNEGIIFDLNTDGKLRLVDRVKPFIEKGL
jgi:hypothetical protein